MHKKTKLAKYLKNFSYKERSVNMEYLNPFYDLYIKVEDFF